MTKVLAGFFMACALLLSAHAAYAQGTPQLALSLFRAVRISDTSLTLSFKTSQSSIGEVTYAQPDGSKIQLTDSALQTDHLFTITELAASHGYTFTLSASVGSTTSNKYAVLLSPDSVGPTGQSIIPGVQVVTASGDLILTSVAASTTAAVPKTFLPWWVFAVLFILFVASWVLRKVSRRSAALANQPPSTTF